MLKDNKMLNNIRKSLQQENNNKINFQYINEIKDKNMNADLMQKIICSNEQLLRSQTSIIKSLAQQISQKNKQIKQLNQQLIDFKYYAQLENKQIYTINQLNNMKKQIQLLEQQLVQTKIQLAIKSSQVLQKQTEIKQYMMKIKLLNGQNKELLSQNLQLQRLSTLSETDYDQRNSKNEILEITKDNVSPDFIKITQSNYNIVFLRSNEQGQNNQKSQKYKYQKQIIKHWQKYVNQHIIKFKTFKSKLSFHLNQKKIQKFIKSTFYLLKKYNGIFHDFRHKIWQFILQDKLSLTNSFYIQLLDRRNRGWVSQQIKKQIQNDINRSFNGEGSKQKLNFIHDLTLNKENSNQQIVNKQQLRQNKQILNTNNFRISEDVTQVLELFYIYRPDIGYVQGMTYPVIILTLITGKINSFKILCNLLLTNEFFRKMITFQPNFINYFCRIFDQILEKYHPKLYQLIIKQFNIKSQIFLVDWFFTFFSRGITPKTILRIWDLLLYQNAIAKNPQIILYRVSLSIFQILQPILLQTNYQQCIRSVRQYYKKIDEEELINNIYNSIKQNNVQKSFEQMFQRIKSRLQRKTL